MLLSTSTSSDECEQVIAAAKPDDTRATKVLALQIKVLWLLTDKHSRPSKVTAKE